MFDSHESRDYAATTTATATAIVVDTDSEPTPSPVQCEPAKQPTRCAEPGKSAAEAPTIPQLHSRLAVDGGGHVGVLGGIRVGGRPQHVVRHDYHDYSMERIEDYANIHPEDDGKVEGDTLDDKDVDRQSFSEEGGPAAGNTSNHHRSGSEIKILPKKRRGPRGGVKVPFPAKLHVMLSSIEEDGLAHIVSWRPHGRCFIVKIPQDFVSQVLPKYFRQSKLTSFQRQLNLYGFSRLTSGEDRGAYYHQLFLRHRLSLCEGMTRLRIKGTGTKGRSSPETEPDFYSMPPVLSLPDKEESGVTKRLGKKKAESIDLGEGGELSAAKTAVTRTTKPTAASGRKRSGKAKEARPSGRKKLKCPPSSSLTADTGASAPRASFSSSTGEYELSVDFSSGSISVVDPAVEKAILTMHSPSSAVVVTPDTRRPMTQPFRKAPGFLALSSSSFEYAHCENRAAGGSRVFGNNDIRCPLELDTQQAHAKEPVSVSTVAEDRDDESKAASPLTLPSESSQDDDVILFEGQLFHYMSSLVEAQRNEDQDKSYMLVPSPVQTLSLSTKPVSLRSPPHLYYQTRDFGKVPFLAAQRTPHIVYSSPEQKRHSFRCAIPHQYSDVTTSDDDDRSAASGDSLRSSEKFPAPRSQGTFSPPDFPTRKFSTYDIVMHPPQSEPLMADHGLTTFARHDAGDCGGSVLCGSGNVFDVDFPYD